MSAYLVQFFSLLFIMVPNFGFNVKMPYDPFRFINKRKSEIDEHLQKLKRKKSKCQSPFHLNAVKREMGIFLAEKQKMADQVKAFYYYIQLKSVNYSKARYNRVKFCKELAEALGISVKHANTIKKLLLKFEYLRRQHDWLYVAGNDTVWRSLGFEVKKHKVVNGKKQPIKKGGVFYKSNEVKITIAKKGELVKGRKLKKPIEKWVSKKIPVPLIKIALKEEEIKNLNSIKDCILQAQLKQYFDNENSCKNPDRRKDDVEGFKLSSKWFADKTGCSSVKSGWNKRIDLEQRGFISITENKIKVEENITYEQAKEKYFLHCGAQEDGYCYFYNKRLQAVFAVKCYSVQINGYEPITFKKHVNRRNKKAAEYIVVSGKRMYLDKEGEEDDSEHFYSYLPELQGKTYKAIFKNYMELFVDENPFLNYLESMQPEEIFCSCKARNIIKGFCPNKQA